MANSSIARRMAKLLFDASIDISDERVVLVALRTAGFSAGDISRHSDEAIECARAMKQNHSRLGDAA